MLQDFERQKHKLDFDYLIKKKQGIILHGTGEQMADLDAKALNKVFGLAFDAGVAAMRTQIQFLARLERDFVVLFVGGSYGNPALRRKVEQVLKEERRKAPRLTIRAAFLCDEERNYLCVGPLHFIPTATLIPCTGRQRSRQVLL